MKSATGLFVVAIAIAVLSLSAGTARAQECKATAPNMLLVVDISGSMDTPTGGPGSPSRWEVVRDAIASITDKYGLNSIRFGLELFADPDQSNNCTAAKVHVLVADNNAAAIQNKMNSEFPWSNTPIRAALDTANAYQGLRDATRSNYVLLFTDGQETCDYDPDSPVQAVKNLRANNIKTFVVGFGTSVSDTLLGQMATEGGTARPVPPYFYATETSAELSDAFEEIASIISAIGGPCFVPGLQGVCAESDWSCENGNVVCLQKNWPTNEICDGDDDNCNGPVDENLVRSCVADGGTGVQICSNGVWGDCIVNFDGSFPDAAPFDAGTPDTGVADAGTSDTGPADAGYLDAGPIDSGPADSGPVDSGPVDAGVLDTGAADTGGADTGPHDGGRPDGGRPDSGMTDSGITDVGPADSGTADAGLADQGVADAGLPDQGIPDAGFPDAQAGDAGTFDTGAPDSGIPDASWADATADDAMSADAVSNDVLNTDGETDAGDQDSGATDRGHRPNPDGGSAADVPGEHETDENENPGATDLTAVGGGCSCAVLRVE